MYHYQHSQKIIKSAKKIDLFVCSNRIRSKCLWFTTPHKILIYFSLPNIYGSIWSQLHELVIFELYKLTCTKYLLWNITLYPRRRKQSFQLVTKFIYFFVKQLPNLFKNNIKYKSYIYSSLKCFKKKKFIFDYYVVQWFLLMPTCLLTQKGIHW